LQILALRFTAEQFGAFGVIAVVPLGTLVGFYLSFYVFAFPASRHASSLHFLRQERVFIREKVTTRSCAGGAGPPQDWTWRTNDGGKRPLRVAGPAFRKQALIGKFGHLVRPTD